MLHPLSRTLRTLVWLLACLFVPGALTVRAAPPAPQAKETSRYGIYLGPNRIGSMVSRTFELTHAGKPALKMEAESQIKLPALGMTVEQQFTLSQVLDHEGKPLTTRLVLNSLGRSSTIDARFEPERVVCDVEAGGQKSQKIVPIPKGVTLTGDPDYVGLKGETLKVGQKATLHFFEPVQMQIAKVETEVVRAENRKVGDKEVPAFLIRTTSTVAGRSESWVDAKGRLLEDQHNLGPIGLRIVREDVPLDPSTLTYEPPKDFAVATSVQTAVKIAEPRKTRVLRLKVSGIPDAGLVLSDTRQQVQSRDPAGEAVTAVYLIQTRELPGRGLPAAAPGAQGPGLGDAPYLGLAEPAIQKQAKELAGRETDRALIARRVRAWVHARMTKPNNVGTLRSAPEIMQSRDGVCRDYATLFASLARAAGVPTRVCSGLVYFKGAFFYHAWNECQLAAGEDGWYAFDSTLDDDFVDATHVKFAQGDPAEMFASVRIVGQIKAEILEHR